MTQSSIKLYDLQTIAKKLGLSTRGTKKQLYDRINYHLSTLSTLSSKHTGGRVVRKSRKRSRSRKSLKRRKSPRKSIRRKKSKKRKKHKKRSYFKRGNKLSEQHQKYCRCVLHVADKQSSECLKGKRWNSSINGKQCYNPFAVCSKSTKRKGSVSCFDNTNLDAVPKSELKAWADLKRMSVSELRLKQK